ncbi:N-acetyltransferase family protein [Labrys sp. La1]|uniref:GNAT family N-acetyltransferase n=1 Tax=Labrys sp. La1 TaxID=3404917 RepID=UPI003EB8A11E
MLALERICSRDGKGKPLSMLASPAREDCVPIDVMIRDFSSADREPCARILSKAGRMAFYWADWPVFDGPGFDEVTKGEQILVAETHNQVVGFAAVYMPENFLHHLYIDPDLAGCGIGATLLGETIRRYGPALSLKCQMRNQVARNFYRKCGWLEDDQPGGADRLGSWLFIRSPGPF